MEAYSSSAKNRTSKNQTPMKRLTMLIPALVVGILLAGCSDDSEQISPPLPRLTLNSEAAVYNRQNQM